jgi:hypothetical protein
MLDGTVASTRTMLVWYEGEADFNEATFLRYRPEHWASIVGALVAFRILHNKQH